MSIACAIAGKAGPPNLVGRLEASGILVHPYVIGELMLGSLRDRTALFAQLRMLPRAPVATPSEIFAMIEREGLEGRGIGHVDAALLASARIEPGVRLWTRDRRLAEVNGEMSPLAADLR